jgi:tetratricopeptide (TPR) repeat protein
VLVQDITNDLMAHDAVLAESSGNVPAAALLARVWSVEPLAAAVRGAPKPVPTWDDFSQSYDHLLRRRYPLSVERWAAAADFAEDVGHADPVAAILLGILVAASWQDSVAGNERDMMGGDAQVWRALFLPLVHSLRREKAVWSARALCKAAIGSLAGVGWQVGDVAGRFRLLQEFRQAEAEAVAAIESAANELVWRLVPDGGVSPEIRLELAALCWLLGDAPRAAVLCDDAAQPAKDSAEFVIRRCLAEVRDDPFLEAGWQRLAEAGVLDKSPELAPIFYRLTRTSHRQMLALDSGVSRGTARQLSRLVYENLTVLLSGRRADVDRELLNDLLGGAKDILWHNFPTGYLRLVALLLASQPEGADHPAEQHDAVRWEWEKLAHAGCAMVWHEAVDQVAATSANRAADLPFYFLPSQSPAELAAALELVEAYRSAGLEYALTVTSPNARPARDAAGVPGRSHQDELRSELRGLRFLQATPRLPVHMRHYYGPPEEFAAGGPLSPERLFDDETNLARQQELRAELARGGADLYAVPKGYGCMRPGSGRVLIDFRRALGYHPQPPDDAAGDPAAAGAEVNPAASRQAAQFDRSLSRARSLRSAGDLGQAYIMLEAAIALAEAAYGRDDVRVAEASNLLGNVLQSLGDTRAAQQCYSRALAIHEAVYGLFHASVATDRHNLGGAAFRLGESLRARAQLERAIGIDTVVYGPQHEEVATDRMTLGEILTATGQLDRACEQYRQALAIRQDAYGPDDPRTARAAEKLATAETMQSLWSAKKAQLCQRQCSTWASSSRTVIGRRHAPGSREQPRRAMRKR